MSLKLKLGQRSQHPQGLTLEQLAQFITDCERAGIAGSEHPKVQVGWRAQIKHIEVANNQEQEAGNE